MILEAPDVYMAASVLVQQTFYNGKGDRTNFIEMVLHSDPTKIPDLGRKLKLITKNEFHGHTIFNDKLCNTLNVAQKWVYKLWLHCCRKFKAVTVEQMIEFAPELKDKIQLWDRHVDEQGRTTLNMVEYMEYRKKCAEQAKVDKLKKKADASNKKKI